MTPIEPFRAVRAGVEEVAGYRFGYNGHALGDVVLMSGRPYRLASLRVRPTTEHEMTDERGTLFQCETVAFLLWEPVR